MNCIGLFVRLQVMCSNVARQLQVLHRIVDEITCTA